jgi:hypothetical protein
MNQFRKFVVTPEGHGIIFGVYAYNTFILSKQKLASVALLRERIAQTGETLENNKVQ